MISMKILSAHVFEVPGPVDGTATPITLGGGRPPASHPRHGRGQRCAQGHQTVIAGAGPCPQVFSSAHLLSRRARYELIPTHSSWVYGKDTPDTQGEVRGTLEAHP